MSPSRSNCESLTSCIFQYSIHQLRTQSIKILMSDQYCSSCQRTHHCKDKCEQIDRYWVEVAAVLDTIRSTVFEKHILEVTNNNAVLSKPHNLLPLLRLGQYSPQ